MPFYLEKTDEMPALFNFNSVLIIPCRFCPAASMALSKNEPYINLFSGFLKTAVYEKRLETMKLNFANRGIKASIFKNTLPHNFTMCMWTGKQRKKLLAQAVNNEAMIVLGCEAAFRTICDSVRSTSCQVFYGMVNKGIMSVKPKFHFPGKISLELVSLTPITVPVSTHYAEVNSRPGHN